MISPASASVGAPRRFSKRRPVLVFLGVLPLVVLLFYGEEDWRGKRAWELCQRDLAAKGQVLDAESLIPPRVPDDQNILKAPKMGDWFGGRFALRAAPATDLFARLSSRSRPGLILLAQFTVLPPATGGTQSQAKSPSLPAVKGDTNLLPTVKFESVPLTDAIRALAVQMGQNIMFDPVLIQTSAPPGILAFNPNVTAKWTNTTATEALSTLLQKYGMTLASDPTTHVARVKAIDLAATALPQATAPSQSGGSGDLASADLVLDYDSPSGAGPPQSDGPGSETAEFIAFDNARLTDAILALAKQSGRNIGFDPALMRVTSPTGTSPRNPMITEKWKNITPDQALFALLENFGMVMVEDAATHAALITASDSAEARLAAQRFARRPDVHVAVASLLKSGLGVTLESPSTGCLLAQRPLDQIKPIRIAVRSNLPMSTAEIESFVKEFPPVGLFHYDGLVVRGNPPDGRTFQALVPVESAVDILAWSDKFEPDFNLIRQGLQRREAQHDDYQTYFQEPTQPPIFVPVRILAQAMAERAQCHLLLGQPDLALRDLTLIHDLPRAFVTRPVNLVGAMITVAVGGLYTKIVSDGLRLQAWREPELATLEEQLQTTNWPLLLAAALATERACDCRTIERMTLAEFGASLTNWFSDHGSASWPASLLPRLLPKRWLFPQNHWLMDQLFSAGPRGWRYQNMVATALLRQELIDSMELSNGIILPEKANAYSRDANLAAKEGSPTTFVASLFAENFMRCVSITAHNQTAANQACVACALERYRLAFGQYPDMLDALAPRFLEKLPRDLIGGQPLKYRREPDGTFLLYSVGWNERDDGGVPPGQGNSDLTVGDWVWQKNSP
jgi:hypothetical protein